MLSSRTDGTDYTDYTASSADTNESDHNFVREQLVRYFEQHKPENVPHVDEWLAMYGARQLLSGLRAAQTAKVGANSDVESASAPQDASVAAAPSTRTIPPPPTTSPGK